MVNSDAATVARKAILLLAFAGLILSGCDSNDTTGSARIDGIVTDDTQYGKTDARIEGAAVTASRVATNGSTQAMNGGAVTDAEGNFSLHTDATVDVVLLVAEKEGFQSQILVEGGLESGSTVRIAPMTAKSHAEARVYVEAKSEGNAESVTVADVAALIDGTVASQIHGGAVTAADVAVAVRNAVNAETGYLRSESGGASSAQIETAIAAKRNAHIGLHADLYAAGSTSAQATAVQEFMEAMIDAYTEANVSLEAQARARQAAVAAVARTQFSSVAQTALRKQATLIAATSTALAVEAEFQGRGASQERLDILTSARADLVAELQAATSAESINLAMSAYISIVRTQLRGELDITIGTLNTAADAMAAAKTALNLAIGTAASTEALVNAFGIFYASAETAVETFLADSLTSADASFGARVLVLVSVT